MNKSQILHQLNSSNGYYVCLRNMFKNSQYMAVLSDVTQTKIESTKFKYDCLSYTKWRGNKDYEICYGYLVGTELKELMEKKKLIQFTISCIFEIAKYEGKKGDLVKLLENNERYYQCKREERIIRKQRKEIQIKNPMQEEQKVKTQPIERIRDMKIKKQSRPPRQNLNKKSEPKPTKLKIVEQVPVNIPVIKRVESSDQQYLCKRDDYKKQNSSKGNICEQKTLATTKILSSDSESDQQLNNLMKRKPNKLKIQDTKSAPTSNQSYMKPKSQTQATMFSYFTKK